MSRLRQTELAIAAADAQQVAALCWRVHRGAVQVLLVTSRDTGRWVIPKGWPIPGLDPHKAALREAWEEAGVKGTTGADCIGLFTYLKQTGPARAVRCHVSVYAIAVETLAKDYPEKRERKRVWVSPAEAAARVSEPDLAALLRAFDPAGTPPDADRMAPPPGDA